MKGKICLFNGLSNSILKCLPHASPWQAHPHPSLYTAAGEGVGGSHFNGSLPETPNLSCPQLAKLIVPFSTPSQHWLTGFQTPLLPNYC